MDSPGKYVPSYASKKKKSPKSVPGHNDASEALQAELARVTRATAPRLRTIEEDAPEPEPTSEATVLKRVLSFFGRS